MSYLNTLKLRFLVIFLLFEALIILSFFLTKGYLFSTLGNGPEKIVEISYLLQKAIFLLPFTTIVYFFLSISYFFVTNNLRIPDWIDTPLIYIFAIVSGILFIWLLLREYPLKKWINENKDKKFALRGGLVFLITIILASVISLILFALLFQTSVFLLCGSYSIEINHFPDSNTEIMSLTIKDTGIPSGKCYIHLYRVNDSNDNLFQPIDNITLQESVQEPSKHMTGEKEGGVYYLFIDTSSLSPDYYFLHAETSFPSQGFNLFVSKKYDDELFYLPPKNKTGKVLNQTSIL